MRTDCHTRHCTKSPPETQHPPHMLPSKSISSLSLPTRDTYPMLKITYHLTIRLYVDRSEIMIHAILMDGNRGAGWICWVSGWWIKDGDSGGSRPQPQPTTTTNYGRIITSLFPSASVIKALSRCSNVLNSRYILDPSFKEYSRIYKPKPMSLSSLPTLVTISS